MSAISALQTRSRIWNARLLMGCTQAADFCTAAVSSAYWDACEASNDQRAFIQALIRRKAWRVSSSLPSRPTPCEADCVEKQIVAVASLRNHPRIHDNQILTFAFVKSCGPSFFRRGSSPGPERADFSPCVRSGAAPEYATVGPAHMGRFPTRPFPTSVSHNRRQFFSQRQDTCRGQASDIDVHPRR